MRSVRITICTLLLTIGGHEAVHAQSADSGYRIVEQWSIPNGGFGRVVVLNKAKPSESVLRSLGDKLRQVTSAERNAFVWVYDDERAARNRRASIAERLTKTERQHHDRHYMAVYIRNANAGYHQYQFYPKGFDGPTHGEVLVRQAGRKLVAHGREGRRVLQRRRAHRKHLGDSDADRVNQRLHEIAAEVRAGNVYSVPWDSSDS